MEGASFVLAGPKGAKTPLLAVRRALKSLGPIKSLIPLADGRLAVNLENVTNKFPESIAVGDVLLRASWEAPRRKKGTIFSRDLIGCTAGEVVEELGEQVTEVRALATRNAATASGRFLLSFPEEIPQRADGLRPEAHCPATSATATALQIVLRVWSPRGPMQ